MAQCEEDLAAAEGDLRERDRLLAEEHLHERTVSLDPETRAEVNRFMGARSRWQAAKTAHDAARSRLDRLLADYPGSIGEYERRATEGGRAGDVFHRGSSSPSRRSDIFRRREPFMPLGEPANECVTRSQCLASFSASPASRPNRTGERPT